MVHCIQARAQQRCVAGNRHQAPRGGAPPNCRLAWPRSVPRSTSGSSEGSGQTTRRSTHGAQTVSQSVSDAGSRQDDASSRGGGGTAANAASNPQQPPKQSAESVKVPASHSAQGPPWPLPKWLPWNKGQPKQSPAPKSQPKTGPVAASAAVPTPLTSAPTAGQASQSGSARPAAAIARPTETTTQPSPSSRATQAASSEAAPSGKNELPKVPASRAVPAAASQPAKPLDDATNASGPSAAPLLASQPAKGTGTAAETSTATTSQPAEATSKAAEASRPAAAMSPGKATAEVANESASTAGRASDTAGNAASAVGDRSERLPMPSTAGQEPPAQPSPSPALKAQHSSASTPTPSEQPQPQAASRDPEQAAAKLASQEAAGGPKPQQGGVEQDAKQALAMGADAKPAQAMQADAKQAGAMQANTQQAQAEQAGAKQAGATQADAKQAQAMQASAKQAQAEQAGAKQVDAMQGAKQAVPEREPQPEQAALSWLASNASMARKLLATADASAIEELLMDEPGQTPILSESDCREVLQAALDRGNIPLALSLHDAMRAARRSSVVKPTYGGAFVWPPASIQSTVLLVLGLCKQVAISEAVRAIAQIRAPVPRNEEVGFGKVISSPLAPGRTLTVVQPQEGFKLVADAYSKYEYEVFSGKVVSCSSEQLQSQANNPLFMLARAVGLQQTMPAAAVHVMTVQAPDGTSRTLRFATETSNVPAQVGERITAVCAPFKNSAKGQRMVFSASPPGRRAGEAMQVTNHKTGTVTTLLQPPTAASQAAIPGWVLPAALLFAGGDAASSLVDPALPAMIAIGSAVALGSIATGTNVLVPRLKQLADRDVTIEYSRQQLLGQYARLVQKSDEVSQEANEDVRVLAKLWQLQSKMESVGHKAAAYEARIERIAKARHNIESRLTKKLELLDGYARVMSMIEIEVEMDIEVPAAELQGIEEQLVRLQELEGLQDDWRIQAEARDEVEKLLRAP